MTKLISIDPGKFKCGLVLADSIERTINQAIILQSEFLAEYVKSLESTQEISKFIIGNGTTSKETIKKLDFIEKNLIIAEEKNTTYRAKERYFELFPIRGLKTLIPREIFIMNKNLDALSALIILEDYFNFKFNLGKEIDLKTWLK